MEDDRSYDVLLLYNCAFFLEERGDDGIRGEGSLIMVFLYYYFLLSSGHCTRYYVYCFQMLCRLTIERRVELNYSLHASVPMNDFIEVQPGKIVGIKLNSPTS